MKELKFYHEKADQVFKDLIKTMDKKGYVCLNNDTWEEDTYNRGVYIERVQYNRRGKFDRIHLYIKHENASKGYTSSTTFIFRFYEEKLKDLRIELHTCELTRRKINKMIYIGGV